MVLNRGPFTWDTWKGSSPLERGTGTLLALPSAMEENLQCLVSADRYEKFSLPIAQHLDGQLSSQLFPGSSVWHHQVSHSCQQLPSFLAAWRSFASGCALGREGF